MPDQLRISLYHLHRLANEIENSLDALEALVISDFSKQNKSSEHLLVGVVVFYCNIRLIAFMDEYKEHTRGLLQPSERTVMDNHIDPINEKFPELKKFRNQVLAHNFRNRKKETVLDQLQITTYKIPATFKEWQPVFFSLQKMREFIKQRYPDLIQEFEERDRKFMQENAPPYFKKNI